MPQEFQVLRCYQCSTFQVHQVKKAKKWNCKMCGEKQSVIKVFGRGTAADCRHHVQKLNSLRGEIEQVTLETPTEPSTFGEQSVEISHTSHTQIGKDNTQSVDRWSMFVTSEQEEEDVAEDDQYDDRFTTDMAEFRQKQMTRKRKRNQKHGDYEDESSEELHYNYGRNQSHARRRPSWKDCTPEGSYVNGGQKDDVDQSETNQVIKLQGNRSYLKKQYQTSSVNSAKDYYRGQRHRSRLDGYENEVDRYSCYNEGQRDELLECPSGWSASTGSSTCQDIKNVHVLNTGQGQIVTEGQGHNRGQGHRHALNDDPSVKRGEGHYQVLTETQSLNKGQGHHQALSKGQSIKGQGHHGGMKKNQSVSKWSKYENSSDSGEENCMTSEQPEMSNLSEKYHIDWNIDNKISAGNDSYVQSRQERNGENTSTVLDYSVDVGNPKDLFYNTDSLTENVISPDRMWRQRQHKMWTGGFSGESKSVAMEGNNNQLKGDNSNRLIGPEEKLVNTSTESQGEDSIRKDQDSKYVKHHQPVTGYSGGTINSYFTENRLIVEPRSVSTIIRCNQMRSNVSNSEQRNSNSGHITRPLTQKSTPLQPLFVTEDITDEDLAL